jgi:spore coat protein I
MRKCNWDIDETNRILDTYDKIYPISRDELELLKIIINFPEKLCKTINRYYNSKKSKAKSGYLVKLQELVDETEPFEQYIKQLRNL